MRLLTENGANIDAIQPRHYDEVLNWAAKTGKHFIKKWVKPKDKTLICQIDILCQRFILYEFIFAGFENIIRVLIDKGANVNAKDENGDLEI